MGFISEIVILVQMEEDDVHELRVRYLRCAVASPTIMGITPVKYSAQRIIYVDRRPRCCWDAFTFFAETTELFRMLIPHLSCHDNIHRMGEDKVRYCVIIIIIIERNSSPE